MKQYIPFMMLFSVALFPGCQAPESGDGPPTVAGTGASVVRDEEEGDALTIGPKDLKDIGDVEQLVRIAATLAEQSATPLLEEDRMESFREELLLSTIDVKPPHPKELWLHFNVTATEPFRIQPVVARARVYRDDEEIGQFQTIVGQYAGNVILPEGAVVPQMDFQFNVLEGLPVLPDTMLVHAEAELSLMPPGTNQDSLDPATASTDPEFTTTKRSNPVRINFAESTE